MWHTLFAVPLARDCGLASQGSFQRDPAASQKPPYKTGAVAAFPPVGWYHMPGLKKKGTVFPSPPTSASQPPNPDPLWNHLSKRPTTARWGKAWNWKTEGGKKKAKTGVRGEAERIPASFKKKKKRPPILESKAVFRGSKRRAHRNPLKVQTRGVYERRLNVCEPLSGGETPWPRENGGALSKSGAAKWQLQLPK